MSATYRSAATLAAVLALAVPTPSPAQIFSTSVTGIVTDQGGAVVPGAGVRITNTETKDVREATTEIGGRYTISQLRPGTYELTVNAAGFKKFARLGIRLQGSQHVEIHAALELGQLTETVEVRAQSILPDTQSANQTTSLNSEELTELPVNFRNPLAFVLNNAGAYREFSPLSSANGVPADQEGGIFAMNGGRQTANSVTVDGISIKGGDWGATFGTPSVDSVQEMQISRNTYDAEYGRVASGVVSLVSKGGGDQYHGTAFWFLRNDNLDANSWERNRAGQVRPEFKRNQYGVNASGPVWKRKRIHFLFGYEGSKLPAADSTTLTVPTALEKSGDFSRSFNANGSLQQIFDPFTTRANPAGAGFIRDAFAGNRIPASRFDPIAVNVAKLFPPPNQPGVGVTTANNLFVTAPLSNDLSRYDGRLDWAASEKFRTFFRVNRTLLNNTGARFFDNGADTLYDNSAPSYSVTWSSTYVPTPTWVINAMAGSGGAHRFAIPIATVEGTSLTDLGYSQAFANQFPAKTFGAYAVADYTTLGQSRAFSNIRRTHSAVANINNERGAHSIKFGFSYENQEWNFVDERTPAMNFNRGATTGPVVQATSSVVGNSMASLLLGVGGGNGVLLPSPAFSHKYLAWYAQDAWRISSRFTLTAGIRYEIQLPRTERYNRQAYFDYDVENPISARAGIPVRGGLRFTDVDNRGLTSFVSNNWAPRLGLAYKLSDRLVMRAGYGISYWQTLVESGISGTSGYTATTTWATNPGGVVPIYLLSNPFPDGLIQTAGSSQGLATLLGSPVEGWRRDNPTPYQQSYSLDFQYELGQGSLFEIGYTGNQGRKLVYGLGRNFNQMPAEHLRIGEPLNNLVRNPFFGLITTGALSGATVPAHNLLRAYPEFTNVTAPVSDKGASARFNALYVKFTRRFSKGFTAIVSYQWAKAMDNASENWTNFGADAIRNVFDPSSDWSISGHDVPHDLVVNFIWELPVGRGKAFGSGLPRAANAIIGGWQLAGTSRLRSGNPINIFAANTISAYGYGIRRANVPDLEAARLDNPVPERWFNVNAFVEPGRFELGTGPRYFTNLRKDGVNYADITLAKTFRIGELVVAQFRSEFFNVTNTPRFGVPDSGGQVTVGSGNFGRADASIIAPRNIQLGLKLMF